MRQFRIDGWALERIEQLRRRPGWTAADVLRELERDPERGDHRIPSERTVRDYIKFQADRDGEAWSIDPDGNPRHDRAVLETLGAAAQRTDRLELSRREARWIAWLAEAAPSLPAYLRLVAVWHINAQEATGRPLTDLTRFLAYEPWAGPWAWRRYVAKIEAGLLMAPGLLFHHAERIALADEPRPTRRSNIPDLIEQQDWYKQQGEADGTSA